MSDDYLQRVFGSEGLLASALPGYRPRPGQLALAELVDQALGEGRCLLGEGPTGTGKSLAYSVPAVYHAAQSNKRIVIATANIALQEQLVTKDLPFLKRVLPWRFRFELVKGRNNYLCQEQLAHSEMQLSLHLAPDNRRQLSDVLTWAQTTDDGDLSELSFVPSPAVRSRVTVMGEDCKGKRCHHHETCLYEKMRERFAGAQILVTNYHLLFAHLALMAKGAAILPAFDALILDEAHEAADIARAFFGFTMTERSLVQLSREVDYAGAEAEAEQLRLLAGGLFAQVSEFATSEAYDIRLRKPGFVDAAPIVQTLTGISDKLLARAKDKDLEEAEQAHAENMAMRADSFAVRLRETAELGDSEKVYWLEVDRAGRSRIKASLIDPSDALRATLFEVCKSVVMVSATMTTQGGSFRFLRREMGVPEAALELVVDTPFDFRRQALLVVPDGLPRPSHEDFLPLVAKHVQQVVDICDGRTLGLFTSYAALDYVHSRLDGRGHTVRRQGEAPRTQLAAAFRDDVHSVLLGTSSFWTGVDVAGESLTALVIDKLPFPRPSDPLVHAICARNPSAFADYLLPCMIMMLRQGVGRLIRAESDRGVVVILDPRLVTSPYAARVRNSLPSMPTNSDLSSIAAFLGDSVPSGDNSCLSNT